MVAKLSELIPLSSYPRGGVFLVKKEKIDGIVMRKGDTCNTEKFYIFIGLSKEENRTAGVVINSKGTEESVCLLHESYSEFLSYNSYADCSTLMTIPTEYIREYKGLINEQDLSNIIDKLRCSRRVKKVMLKHYGIIE